MKQTSLTVPKAKPVRKKVREESDEEFIQSFQRGLDDIRAGRVIRVR